MGRDFPVGLHSAAVARGEGSVRPLSRRGHRPEVRPPGRSRFIVTHTRVRTERRLSRGAPSGRRVTGRGATSSQVSMTNSALLGLATDTWVSLTVSFALCLLVAGPVLAVCVYAVWRRSPDADERAVEDVVRFVELRERARA